MAEQDINADIEPSKEERLSQSNKLGSEKFTIYQLLMLILMVTLIVATSYSLWTVNRSIERVLAALPDKYTTSRESQELRDMVKHIRESLGELEDSVAHIDMGITKDANLYLMKSEAYLKRRDQRMKTFK